MGTHENLPVVAIVGRPNVGKSTLFNRLSRARRAIVDDQPGVTRDRNYNEVSWRRRRFVLVDTGGMEPDEREGFKGRILHQTMTAVAEAEVIVFLLDGRTGPMPPDTAAVELLRQASKPVFYAVNKLDTGPRESDLYEFYRLGVERLYPLSAEHGLGVADLMQEVVDALPREAAGDREAVERLALAVVGRPNVGKSTLVNRLVGYDRSLVDSRPGTTRDALQTDFTWNGTVCRLTDTAGIRRKARVVDPVERYSVSRALRSVDTGDVVIHLLDGVEGVTDQDLLDTEQVRLREYRNFLRRRLPFVDHVPIVSLSAVEGSGMNRLMDMVIRVGEAQRQWIKTPVLNRVLRRLTERHAAPQLRGRPVKVYYATQTDVRPPTFTLFVNNPQGFGAGYQRYIVKALRAELGLEHAPLRLTFRARAGRDAD